MLASQRASFKNVCCVALQSNESIMLIANLSGNTDFDASDKLEKLLLEDEEQPQDIDGGGCVLPGH